MPPPKIKLRNNAHTVQMHAEIGMHSVVEAIRHMQQHKNKRPGQGTPLNNTKRSLLTRVRKQIFRSKMQSQQEDTNRQAIHTTEG